MYGIFFLSIAILLRILANPAANVVQKQLTAKGTDPILVNCGTYAMLALVCIVPAFTINWQQWSTHFWLYSVAVGITGALGNAFLVKALQSGELSVLGPVNSYKSVVSIVIGIFLLNEIPGIWGLLGMMLIIYGSYFVLDTTEERFTPRLLRRRDVRFRIFAMVLTAIEAVLLKKVIIYSSVPASFISWCWFGAFFSFVMLLVYGRSGLRKQLYTFNSRYIGKFLLLAACIGTMQFCTNFVFERMPVGYALALFQLSTIVTVGFGYHFFREQQIRKKLLGTLIMLAGSVMIILLL